MPAPGPAKNSRRSQRQSLEAPLTLGAIMSNTITLRSSGKKYSASIASAIVHIWPTKQKTGATFRLELHEIEDPSMLRWLLGGVMLPLGAVSNILYVVSAVPWTFPLAAISTHHKAVRRIPLHRHRNLLLLLAAVSILCTGSPNGPSYEYPVLRQLRPRHSRWSSVRSYGKKWQLPTIQKLLALLFLFF